MTDDDAEWSPEKARTTELLYSVATIVDRAVDLFGLSAEGLSLRREQFMQPNYFPRGCGVTGEACNATIAEDYLSDEQFAAKLNMDADFRTQVGLLLKHVQRVVDEEPARDLQKYVDHCNSEGDEYDREYVKGEMTHFLKPLHEMLPHIRNRLQAMEHLLEPDTLPVVTEFTAGRAAPSPRSASASGG
jgi:hypothetical protein